MRQDLDLFTAPELYLLAAAFGGSVLFGLPEKETYQLQGQEVFKEAHKQLIHKGLLSPDGKMTRGGAMVIKAVEYYHKSKKYVRINNLMFAFREKEEDELILLIELEEEGKYQLKVMSKAIVLKLLMERFPLVMRKPAENEIHFLKRELSDVEREETKSFEPEPMFMNLELFHLTERPQVQSNPDFYQQWLIFTKEDQLIMADTVRKRYYQASQYWFMKVLFDEMDFPYKEEKSYA